MYTCWESIDIEVRKRIVQNYKYDMDTNENNYKLVPLVPPPYRDTNVSAAWRKYYCPWGACNAETNNHPERHWPDALLIATTYEIPFNDVDAFMSDFDHGYIHDLADALGVNDEA